MAGLAGNDGADILVGMLVRSYRDDAGRGGVRSQKGLPDLMAAAEITPLTWADPA